MREADRDSFTMRRNVLNRVVDLLSETDPSNKHVESEAKEL